MGPQGHRRLTASAGQFDRAASKLRRVWCGHDGTSFLLIKATSGQVVSVIWGNLTLITLINHLSTLSTAAQEKTP
jgi:hypothetical protein